MPVRAHPAVRRRLRLRRRLAVVFTVLATAVTLSGCSLLGGDDTPEQSDGEVTQLNIAVLHTLDIAPLHYAMAKGYFRDEGLTVKMVDGKSGGDNVTKLISGDVDIAFSSYSPFFLAQSKGAADIKLIADASATKPENATIMARSDSGITKVSDLAGKKVGVSDLNTMAHLLAESVAQVGGVDIATIQWVPMSFPETVGALVRRDIDAAYLTEPFRQEGLRNGLMDIADTSSGPTDGIPLTGYGALAEWVKQNPNTVAAYQRAMVRATIELNTTAYNERPAMVLTVLPGLPDDVPFTVGWPELAYGLHPKQIQRTADLMDEFDVIPRLDVRPMLVRPKLPAG